MKTIQELALKVLNDLLELHERNDMPTDKTKFDEEDIERPERYIEMDQALNCVQRIINWEDKKNEKR